MGYGYNLFGTPRQWAITLLLVAIVGYLALRGCEAALGYVGRHVNVEWTK